MSNQSLSKLPQHTQHNNSSLMINGSSNYLLGSAGAISTSEFRYGGAGFGTGGINDSSHEVRSFPTSTTADQNQKMIMRRVSSANKKPNSNRKGNPVKKRKMPPNYQDRHQ